MATEYQTMPNIMALMAQAKSKSGYSNALQVEDLNSFSGRGWGANYLDELYKGRMQPNADAIDVFTNYLLKRFYIYCSS